MTKNVVLATWRAVELADARTRGASGRAQRLRDPRRSVRSAENDHSTGCLHKQLARPSQSAEFGPIDACFNVNLFSMSFSQLRRR